jgi:hypothetical protein
MTRTVTGGLFTCMFFDTIVRDEIGIKKWVLRVLIPGAYSGDLLDKKFRSEVATMKLVYYIKSDYL